VVGFSNTAGRLLPGMTANVRVVTESRDSVLKIPNAALRVRIAGVEPAAAPGAGAGAAPGARPASAAGATGSAGSWSWLPQAQAQPAGGGLAAMRDRLVSELRLSTQQQGKLDAITGGMQPQFAALRELPEAQRPAAREQALAEMRSQINAMLTPEQKTKYAQLQTQAQAQQAGPAPAATADAGKTAAPAAATPGKTASSGPAAAGAAAKAPAAAPATRAAPAAPAAPAAGGGNAAAEFRARLQTELKLTPSQLEKVDAIYADARPKFMQLRDLPAEERTKARDRISAEVRSRIGDLLTPEQKPGYAAILAESAGRASTRGRIYLLAEDGKPRAYNVRLGITDGTSTELIVPPGSPDAAELKEGATVIIGINAPGSTPAPARAAGPRMAF